MWDWEQLLSNLAEESRERLASSFSNGQVWEQGFIWAQAWQKKWTIGAREAELLEVGRKAKEAARTSEMRRFSGQETHITVRAVVSGGQGLGKRREGHGETAAGGPRDPTPELEAQRLLSRPQVPIWEEIGYWEQTPGKGHPVRAETGLSWWEKAALSQVKLAN